ncbi:MAG: protein kinase [Cyanobacteriota bacterium]|nr:protein kinase [Cyanobacteriota bacterium]
MTQIDSFICINSDCRAANDKNKSQYIDFKESNPTCPQCNSILGQRSSSGDVYFFKGFIDRGGGGSVYEACKRIGKRFEGKYAIKVLHPRPGSSLKECKDELELEFKNLKKACKAGTRVPQYIDCSSPEIEPGRGVYFLVQEFLEGENLASILKNKRRIITEDNLYFTEPTMFQYLIDLLETLHLLHNNHILHRDIKLSNIIQKKQENIKNLYLVDFGSSKKLEPGISNKYTKHYARTPFYAPPETLREDDFGSNNDIFDKYKWLIQDFDLDELLESHRWTRDIYSLGVTIFELLTKTPEEIYSILRWRPSDRIWNKWMSDLRQNFPNLYPILERMTRFYPDERYQTALEALLDASSQAWYIYGDSWLIEGELLKNALNSVKRKKNNLPVLQERFLEKSEKQQDRKDFENIFDQSILG